MRTVNKVAAMTTIPVATLSTTGEVTRIVHTIITEAGQIYMMTVSAGKIHAEKLPSLSQVIKETELGVGLFERDKPTTNGGG